MKGQFRIRDVYAVNISHLVANKEVIFWFDLNGLEYRKSVSDGI
jgi:hypothetical protein